jgi:hypothetical protein
MAGCRNLPARSRPSSRCSFPARTSCELAGMPGPLIAADKLDDPAIASNIKMGRNLRFGNRRKIRVSLRIKAVEKEFLNPVATKLIGRQADVVHDNQRHRSPAGRSPGWAMASQRAHSASRLLAATITRYPGVPVDSAWNGRSRRAGGPPPCDCPPSSAGLPEWPGAPVD